MATHEIQRQRETFRTEEHEVQNADWYFDAYEKANRMVGLVPEGSPEQKHYER